MTEVLTDEALSECAESKLGVSTLLDRILMWDNEEVMIVSLTSGSSAVEAPGWLDGGVGSWWLLAMRFCTFGFLGSPGLLSFLTYFKSSTIPGVQAERSAPCVL